MTRRRSIGIPIKTTSASADLETGPALRMQSTYHARGETLGPRGWMRGDRLPVGYGSAPRRAAVQTRNKTRVTVAGIVTHRQRPRQRPRRHLPQPRRTKPALSTSSTGSPSGPPLPRRPRLARPRHRSTLERAHNLTNILAELIQRLQLTMSATSRDVN